jgi:cyclic pyranopterin phosphate synthase
MEQEIEARSRWVEEREMHRRKRYHLKAGGIVEVVKPMHNSEFCRFCTRLRMTSNGDLKPCLMRSDNHVGVAPLLRGETRREDLVDAFEEATARREPFWRK